MLSQRHSTLPDVFPRRTDEAWKMLWCPVFTGQFLLFVTQSKINVEWLFSLHHVWKMPLDYSKWKNIEVSDDEDDTHPNIDTPSLFRWRHQARMERMAERKQEKEEITKGKTNVEKRMLEIEEKLKSTGLDEKERIKLELERDEVKKQEEDYLKKEKELEEKERLEPWNVDTIGHEAFSSSRINKVTEKRPQQPKMTYEEETKRMADYFDSNGELLKEFGSLKGLDASEKFLLEHPHIASEFAANFLTIEALNMAIEMKEDEMSNYAEQCIIVQYLLELSKSLHALATNTNVIKNFFKKFRSADPEYLKSYRAEVEAFKDRLRKRAKDKRDAAIEEYEAEEKAKRIAASPGGVDPQEVYDSLPPEMKEAFDSQDVARLQAVAQSMDQEVFCHHLKRCIDSGLWIPDANAHNEADGTATKNE
ncbi:putative Hsp90 co-chaperone cdc37 [Toxocara canis]|uniref:Hsp90 chaperone protein kinase-targeting subunit n=1 Tax=Toxocara canis TaxID=6265 RepID=A0A0B2VYU4_TOXCA|nr:putative Hsp90 co-chaperone cdc37 [Toxocara canis]